MNWQIEQGCPQCGAPATLGETDRLLACPFCRTRLYLVPNGHFRYHIPPATRETGELLYFPYWRSRGASFSVTAKEVSGRIADASRLAVAAPGLPASLGLRPQVLRLRFVNPDTAGRFVAPDLAAPEAIPLPKAMPRDHFYRGYIGETVSLIHAPYYLRDETLFDGILGRPVCACRAAERDRLSAAPPAPADKVGFVPVLCPHCGWDMEGERDSLVLICRNCDSAWHCPEQAFEPVAFSILSPPPGSGDIALYLPFWRMTPRFTGIDLRSRADLIRLANLPRATTAALESAPLHFWSPAFKIHPALWARWSRQMTVFAPGNGGADRLPATLLHPVTLALAEAAEGIVLTLAQMIAAKRKVYPALAGLGVTLAGAHLEYHPFIATHRELRHPRLGVTLDRTALAFGRGL
jgi:hypothetical protein